MAWQWTQDTEARLQRFLEDAGITRGPLSIKGIGDGHSNLTYLVSDGRSEVVVRRPPPPPIPKGAHDVKREAQVLQALEGSRVPVAKVFAVADEGEVLDVPLYVMSYVEGFVISETTAQSALLSAVVPDMAFALVQAMADLHKVDWEAAGLAGYGRPKGFNGRHLKRIRSLIVNGKGELPQAFGEIENWLSNNVPVESAEAIVHGDFRIGNVIFSTGPAVKLLAVLDWELATLGDPLLDLAYLLCSWPSQSAPATPLHDMSSSLFSDACPSREALAERYAALTGSDISNLRWYQVFVEWKLAVLYEFSRRAGKDKYYATPGLVEAFLASAKSMMP